MRVEQLPCSERITESGLDHVGHDDRVRLVCNPDLGSDLCGVVGIDLAGKLNDNRTVGAAGNPHGRRPSGVSSCPAEAEGQSFVASDAAQSWSACGFLITAADPVSSRTRALVYPKWWNCSQTGHTGLDG